MNIGLRFTDRDVRRHEALHDIASEYAYDYDGDFEPLVAARAIVRGSGFLTVPQVRVVLNCLRQDLDPIAQPYRIEAETLRRVGLDQSELRPPLRVVRDIIEEEKRAYVEKHRRHHQIETKVKVKKPYGSPVARQGVIHIVEWAECLWTLPQEWQARKLSPEKRGLRTPKLRVYWMCGSLCDKVSFYDDDQIDYVQRALCKRCFGDGL